VILYRMLCTSVTSMLQFTSNKQKQQKYLPFKELSNNS
jgi:hypothetical protein